MRLVAGVDSSTQSCKVVIRDADTGALVRHGSAPHPDGTEVDPGAWWRALTEAIAEAGGLDDVAALSVAGQQHGMVCLDENGRVVRPALLWNDTRSAAAAADLVAELGARAWADAVGTVPVAALTTAKLRWLAEHEPDNAARTAAVCLPHDWLTWRLSGSRDIATLTTDRSDASGTGYWSPALGSYRLDLLNRALGHIPVLPTVLRPTETAGQASSGGADTVLAVGAGDNAAAALGLDAQPGDLVVSIGTSGTVFAVHSAPTADATGVIAGFADATDGFLPLVCTLNAARVLEAAAAMGGRTLTQLSDLALSAPPGADGLTVIPYLAGERTPNRPHATGAVHGLRLDTATPAHLARAAVEGMLCGLADGVEPLADAGVTARRVLLIGGGARSEAVRRIAPTVFGRPVDVPPVGEYVADGAAAQAAALIGAQPWPAPAAERFDSPATPSLRERYRELREHTATREPLPDIRSSG